MRKKIILIIVMGIILTFFIYQHNKDDKIYLLSLGDGIASGMTAYHVEGYNYNDYLRDSLEKNNQLKQYVHEFSKSEMSIENLITCIENNYVLEETNLTIQQALAKADITTIAIGMDELATLSLKQNILNREREEFKKDMEQLLKLICNFNEGKMFLIGLYKAYNIEDSTIDELNHYLKELSQQYSITYIDSSDLINNPEYFLLDTSYYLSYKGHQELFKRIKKEM